MILIKRNLKVALSLRKIEPPFKFPFSFKKTPDRQPTQFITHRFSNSTANSPSSSILKPLKTPPFISSAMKVSGDDFPDEWQDPDAFLSQQDSLSQSLSSSSETYLLGFVIANIVGIRYYSGTISGREMVGLVREPLNPYDPNAIKVLNTRMLQVGHIECTVAAVLAPLIDSGLIAVEGIVPKKRASSNRFRIPCQIHVFCLFEAFSDVSSAISRAGLMLISDSDASFGLSEAVVVEDRKAKKGNRSVDKIFKLVDEGLSKKGKLRALEPPKDVIESELLAHQKEGLWWLAHRENSGELPPFWEERDGSYVNVLTNYQSDSRPEPLRGGIFADDMGLGKTLTLLSLVAFDKYPSGLPFTISSGSDNVDKVEEFGGEGEEVSVSTSSGKKGKRGRPIKKNSGSRKRPKIDDTKLDNDLGGKSGGKTTLIVCPPSVFSTWITQLGDHTKQGSFKVYMYYGDRTDNAEELKKYDIVLTTYSTLATENSWSKSAAKEMNWWRVILDEAHMIKNANALQSRAVCDLKASRRWAVTGTPIQNDSFDLFSLMAFLRFEPFSVKSYWQSLVQRPLAQGNEKGLSRLQVLMATISLRRTKDKALIGLPPKTIETCYLELSKEEREVYDQMERVAKNVLQGYIDAGGPTCNYTTVLSTILRLRQICIDLALCPSDIKSLLPSNSMEDVSNNPELLQKIVEVLQDGEDFDCPICISPPTDMVITCCGHIFCHACILKTLKHTKSSCPLCRRPLTTSDLFSAPPQSSNAENDASSSRSTISSKVSALLKLLVASRDHNSATKSVVFSQFRKMLLLLEKPLKEAGFKILRIDGSMNAKKRAQVIEEFGASKKDETTILLASLKASGTGINLTAASRVYFLEPWWNPAVEEQAMDRIHRIGQKEEVKIVRLIARDTVEERVLELQERKKKLAREAFGKRGSKDRREIGISDLRALMSL